MTADHCSVIKAFLEEVKGGKIIERNAGLCPNFTYFCASYFLAHHEANCAKEIFKSMQRNSPMYTGDYVYPLVPAVEYHAHIRAGIDFFDIRQPQGKIRHEFIEWALKELAQKEVSYMKD